MIRSEPAIPERPRVFIGSSTEGLEVASSLQVLFDHDCEVEIWTQGLFAPGGSTLQSLVQAAETFDFAILVVSPDDTTISRGSEKSATRDNVVFELGLFMGVLGDKRTFMIYDRAKRPDLPSDLAGVTAVTFIRHRSGNLEASLGAASTQIRRTIDNLKVRNKPTQPRPSTLSIAADFEPREGKTPASWKDRKLLILQIIRAALPEELTVRLNEKLTVSGYMTSYNYFELIAEDSRSTRLGIQIVDSVHERAGRGGTTFDRLASLLKQTELQLEEALVVCPAEMIQPADKLNFWLQGGVRLVGVSSSDDVSILRRQIANAFMRVPPPGLPI